VFCVFLFSTPASRSPLVLFTTHVLHMSACCSVLQCVAVCCSGSWSVLGYSWSVRHTPRVSTYSKSVLHTSACLSLDIHIGKYVSFDVYIRLFSRVYTVTCTYITRPYEISIQQTSVDIHIGIYVSFYVYIRLFLRVYTSLFTYQYTADFC